MLTEAFARTTVLDTNVFMKTVMRQRAIPAGDGAPPTWCSAPTPLGAPLDRLLADNLAAVEGWLGRGRAA
jgi:hypothetical protein